MSAPSSLVPVGRASCPPELTVKTLPAGHREQRISTSRAEHPRARCLALASGALLVFVSALALYPRHQPFKQTWLLRLQLLVWRYKLVVSLLAVLVSVVLGGTFVLGCRKQGARCTRGGAIGFAMWIFTVWPVLISVYAVHSELSDHNDSGPADVGYLKRCTDWCGWMPWEACHHHPRRIVHSAESLASAVSFFETHVFGANRPVCTLNPTPHIAYSRALFSTLDLGPHSLCGACMRWCAYVRVHRERFWRGV